MGIVRLAYMRWRALRLPWRRDVLAGTDLGGNMYFEQLARRARRPRRHVLYRKDISLSEYSDRTIPVQWQAWLRHTRTQAPTLEELIQDIQRQERIAASVERLAERGARAPEPAQEPDPQPQQFQKSAPGEGFQPESWEPAPGPRARGQHSRAPDQEPADPAAGGG
ncbi:hypothetical protein H4R18_004163 [Coemansia javaensis]|uniref:NADH dehydrogenase [ubiquinone] 1 alpha subcomplex subunit n=1 Tax=Coemansia javaensis TaxID=2761396 RepID=A0A9W8LG72_9FUNG|nr:hypothetical protein H4R18_004163 [Coemansia javaensis]